MICYATRVLSNISSHRTAYGVRWIFALKLIEAMRDFTWSDGEKKLARRVFEGALQAELAEVMADFKSRADAAKTPDGVWELEGYLRGKRTGIDRKYDYRYSQLISVFAQLLREERVREAQLAGFSEEKLAAIRLMAGIEEPRR